MRFDCFIGSHHHQRCYIGDKTIDHWINMSAIFRSCSFALLMCYSNMRQCILLSLALLLTHLYLAYCHKILNNVSVLFCSCTQWAHIYPDRINLNVSFRFYSFYRFTLLFTFFKFTFTINIMRYVCRCISRLTSDPYLVSS